MANAAITPRSSYNRPVIPAVVLAAGLSTRMGGRPKALLTVADGRTFAEAIIDAFLAADIGEIVVVVGHDGARVQEHLARTRPRARILVNPSYHSGQYSSVLAGLNAIDRPGVAAMLMTLVDVPGVAPATVRAVVDRFRATAAPIVRPVRGDEHGHPVLIARALFEELRHANPAEGAKAIVRAHASAAGDVPVQDDLAFRDVDTPAAHEALLRGFR
jgi:CTP:molybdopterin cytidylyltransferase MocA